MGSATGQGLTKQTLSGFKWSSISTVIQFGLQFLSFTLMAHLLTPREFGIVGIATIFTNFIERVGFLGIGQALVQREVVTDAHIRCAFVLCLLFGFTLYAGFFVAAPALSVFFEEPELVPVLRAVSFSFVFGSMAEVPMSLLQRNLRFKDLMVVTNVAFVVGNGVVGLGLALLGYSYWSLVAAIVVGRIIRLVLSFAKLPQVPSLDFSYQDVKDLLHIGIGFSLGRMTNYCALVGDNFMTGKMLGAEALGLYTRAYQLMTAPATYFGQILERVFFAALSQRQGEPEKVMKYHLYGIELCAMVSISGAVLLSVAAPEVVTVLFGEHWLAAVPPLRILAFGVFFRTCYKNSDTVIRAMGAVYSLAFRQTLYAAAVLGGAWFGSRWGIEGVAYAVLFAVFLNYALLSILCGDLIKLPWSAFGRAHAAAVWLAVWQYLTLRYAFGAFRAADWSAFVSLPACLVLDGLVSLFVLWLAPEWCAPKVFRWLAKNLGLERFGRIGRLGHGYLLRGAPAAS